MSASQVQGHKWATVSLPNGASSAVRAIKDNWDYIMGFETVVLMLDTDEAGRKAAEEAAEVLPIGKMNCHPAGERREPVSPRRQGRRHHQRDPQGGNTALMASWQQPITARLLVWTMLPRP